jgi:hypothetical protein
MRSAWPLAPGWLAGPLAMALTCTAYGQTASGAVSGHVTAGFRSVDADGAISKFREDVNLEDGARLFDAAVSYRPDAGQNALVDQLDFRAEGLGGDPYASLRLSMRKNGSYEFDLNRVQSKYFYADTITPAELASISGSTGGDLHRFDFERTRDTARLEWLISPATTVDFGLEHLARKGDSTTTLALERDEFELEQPLDESLRILSAGVQHRWDKMTLLF